MLTFSIDRCEFPALSVFQFFQLFFENSEFVRHVHEQAGHDLVTVGEWANHQRTVTFSVPVSITDFLRDVLGLPSDEGSSDGVLPEYAFRCRCRQTFVLGDGRTSLQVLESVDLVNPEFSPLIRTDVSWAVAAGESCSCEVDLNVVLAFQGALADEQGAEFIERKMHHLVETYFGHFFELASEIADLAASSVSTGDLALTGLGSSASTPRPGRPSVPVRGRARQNLKQRVVYLKSLLAGDKKSSLATPEETLRIQLAEALARLGKFADAGVQLERAIELDPMNESVHADLCNAYVLCKSFDRAREAAVRALCLFPTSDTPLILQGHVSEQEGKLEDAVAWFQRALDRHPSAAALCGMGTALAGLDRIEEAQDCLERAVRADPAQTDARIELAHIAEKQGHRARAIRLFEEALEEDSSHSEAHTQLGLLKMQESDKFTNEAIDNFRLSLEHASTKACEARAHFNLAGALQYRAFVHACGDGDSRPIEAETEAVAHYVDSLRLQPGFQKAMTNLGFLYEARGDTYDAIGQYKRAVSSNPLDGNAWTRLGDLFYRSGALPAAAESYWHALFAVGEQPPKPPDFHPVVQSVAAQEHAQPAEPGKPRSTQLNTNKSRLYTCLAVTLRDLGDIDSAIECFRQALRLHPADPTPHVCMQQLLRERDRENACVVM